MCIQPWATLGIVPAAHCFAHFPTCRQNIASRFCSVQSSCCSHSGNNIGQKLLKRNSLLHLQDSCLCLSAAGPCSPDARQLPLVAAICVWLWIDSMDTRFVLHLQQSFACAWLQVLTAKMQGSCQLLQPLVYGFGWTTISKSFALHLQESFACAWLQDLARQMQGLLPIVAAICV